MKYKLTFLFVAFGFSLFGQNIKVYNEKLKEAFEKINFWSSYNYDRKDDDKVNSYDSLDKYNDRFRKLLLSLTSSNAETLTYDFKDLAENGLRIITSEDSLFRIYTWDTQSGGTMHFFRNVFQFRDKSKVLSEAIDYEEGDAGTCYLQINDVISENKKFYITQSVAVLSSANSYHVVKVFSIDNSKLNDKAALIKTKTGIRNEVGYEVDLTSDSNKNRSDVPDFAIGYDKKNKIISIPIILEDGKVTSKKIKYQFKGKYFERI